VRSYQHGVHASWLVRRAGRSGLPTSARVVRAHSRSFQGLLRDRSSVQRVTYIELFYDLVYVFAVTQLSHNLLAHPTMRGVLESALLLAMIWQVWSYTTWVTNWTDPERLEIRLLLVVLMLLSLAMSSALPRAFGDLGWIVGGAYAVQQAVAACSWPLRCAVRCGGPSRASSSGAWLAAR
jgi:low temperature requirement protein LtrA